MICAVIPADQSFWVRLMARDMDIWPTLTIRRSQELIVTWIRKRVVTFRGARLWACRWDRHQEGGSTHVKTGSSKSCKRQKSGLQNDIVNIIIEKMTETSYVSLFRLQLS